MKRYINNAGQEFSIIKKLDGKNCLVQFTSTGYTRQANIDNVKAGKCRDHYAISKNGVGYLGEPNKSLSYYRQAYQLWANMLKRCYSDDPKGYKWKGTTVDARWFCFANFLDDLPKLEGFDAWVNKLGMNLDKDTKVKGNNVYSREACCFISEGVNKSEGAKTRVGGYKRTILKLKGSN